MRILKTVLKLLIDFWQTRVWVLEGFVFKYNNYSDSVEGFLSTDTFAYTDNKNLSGAVFINSKAPVSTRILEYKITFYLDTFKDFKVYQFNGSSITNVNYTA